MAYRNVVFAPGEIYHIFNRGVERREVFGNKHEYERALRTAAFYLPVRPLLRFSHFLNLDSSRRDEFINDHKKLPHQVAVLAYCLMPNHFHFILKEKEEQGISKFMANFTNSYNRFFNTKHNRVGSLFQGPFKAVWVESNFQLLHLSRYVHLNPISNFLVKKTEFHSYPWSSLRHYLGLINDPLIEEASLVLSQFNKRDTYEQFVDDYISYAQDIETIKHLVIDEEV